MPVFSSPLITPARFAPKSLWTPYALRSLIVAWLHADDHANSSLMTDDGGGLISSWTDRIAGRTWTASGAGRPQWSTTALNGFAGLTGDGVNTLMTNNVVTGFPAQCEVWILAVMNVASPPNLAMLLRLGNGGKMITRNNTFTALDAPSISDGNIGLTADDVNFNWKPVGVPHVIGGYWYNAPTPTEGGRWDGRDFSPVATATTGGLGAPSTRTCLFSNAAGTAQFVWPGAIRQILITQSPLPLSQRQRIEGYLAKDGVVKLIPSHPYFVSPP
jgi:hypothetical protein